MLAVLLIDRLGAEVLLLAFSSEVVRGERSSWELDSNSSYAHTEGNSTVVTGLLLPSYLLEEGAEELRARS